MLGLEEGRFLLRRDPEEPTPDVDPDLAPKLGRRVLVVQILGAAPKPPRRLGRRRKPPPDAPDELRMTRVTAIRADRPLGSPEEAEDWMRSLQRDRHLLEEALTEAFAALSRAVHAFAVAKGGPRFGDPTFERSEAVRIGHGLGRDLAAGRYTDAFGIDPNRESRRRRRAAATGQARVAAILGGRERPDACEAFVIDARAALDAGRAREAAVGTTAAAEAMAVELQGKLTDPAHEADMAELAGRLDGARALARSAARGPLDGDSVGKVAELLELCERVLRRRRLLRG